MKSSSSGRRDEIMVALRMMRKDKEPLHAFDFDGTTNGVTEPWSIMLLIAPKDHVDRILTALQFFEASNKGQAMTITQLRGDTIFATMETVHRFPAYLSRQDYEARTGRTCPAYDPTRHVKRWEDPDALSSPSTVTYDVIRIDTGSKCVVNDTNGNPCFEKMALPSTEAFRVNLPPSIGTDPNINGEIRMPCRVLNAEWREEFVWQSGLPTVRVKDRPVEPMQQIIEMINEMKRGQDRIEAAVAELQASKGLLAQIAESFTKKKGVDAAPKV